MAWTKESEQKEDERPHDGPWALTVCIHGLAARSNCLIGAEVCLDVPSISNSNAGMVDQFKARWRMVDQFKAGKLKSIARCMDPAVHQTGTEGRPQMRDCKKTGFDLLIC